ncbi:MAG: acyl carrier protein [Ktedonobacterales bacterium]|nr:acyl carrier protein [Ktedonobacterales bacterium]
MANDVTGAAPLEAIRRELREYIGTNFMLDGGTTRLDDDSSLVEEGIVDPTGVLELVLWVEESYGIHIAETDLGPENFDSINGLARYILRRMSDE